MEVFEFEFAPGAGPQYIEQFVLAGRPVLPLGAALELVLAAIKEWSGRAQMTLRSVRVFGAIPLDEACLVQVQLLEAPTMFRVVHRSMSGGRPRVYLQGDIAITPDARAVQSLTHLAAARVLRNVRELTLSAEDVLPYVVHPLALEAAFGLVEGLAPRSAATDSTCVCAIVALTVTGPLDAPVIATAGLQQNGEADGGWIALSSRAGETAVVASGVRHVVGSDLQALSRECMVQHVIDVSRDVLKGRPVKRSDELISLGAGSLDVLRMINGIGEWLDITLDLEAIVQQSTPEAIAELCLIAQQEQASAAASVPPPITSAASWGQKQLWFLERFGQVGPAYHEGVTWLIDRDLSIDLLSRALTDLSARHESLRTVFAEGPDGLERKVLPAIPVTPAQLASAATDSEIEASARAFALQPFDLQTGPLFRAAFAHAGAGRMLVVLVAHHIVVDGWSLRQVLLPCLHELCSSTPVATADARTRQGPSYDEFVAFEQLELERQRDKEPSFWKNTLIDVPSVMTLPLDYPRTLRQGESSYSAQRISFELPVTLVQSLRDAARRHNTTAPTLFLTAFELALAVFGHQETFCLGVVTANRTRARFEALVGLCANLVPVRADVRPELTIAAFIDTVKERLLAGFARQHVPFAAVVSETQHERDAHVAPLVQVAFSFDEVEADDEWKAIDIGATKFDVHLHVTSRAQQAQLTFEYRRCLFFESTMQALGALCVRMLEAVASGSDRTLAELSWLEPLQCRALLQTGRGPTVRDVAGVGLGELFSHQAEHTPTAPAVSCRGHTMCYDELEIASNQLAHWLVARGARPGVHIGLCLERNLDMAVALLGVLKAGAAYVPLDASLPRARLGMMIADAEIELILSDRPSMSALDARARARAHTSWRAESATSSSEALVGRARGGDAAYIIYTSGSTGEPKGVVVEHRNVVSLFAGLDAMVGERAGSPTCFLATTTLAFDISVFETLWTLARGFHMVVHPGIKFWNELVDSAELQQVTHFQCTPSGLRFLLSSGRAHQFLHSLHQLIVCGEALTPELAREVKPLLSGRFTNAYGPTETTVFASYTDVEPEAEYVALGGPFVNTTLSVRDARGQLVPPGAFGELWVSGAGVARGYNAREQLTADRFVPDSLALDLSHARAYRTGDLARMRSDGRFEFLGRIDEQIKIRGFRVELSEIEAVLRSQPEVRDCCVVLQTSDGDQSLVAFVVTPQVQSSTSLREQLGRSLPAYMIPRAFVRVDDIPQTSSGKVDRRKLAGLARAAELTGVAERVLPRSALEWQLHAIWCDVLRQAALSVDDEFFAVGGDSLSAIRAVSKIHEQLRVTLPLARFFALRTIAAIALAIEAPEQLERAQLADDAAHVARMRQDAKLALDVRPMQGASISAERVLLTGATGFFGIHLLRELLSRSQRVVYCLVRAKDRHDALQRIEDACRRFVIELPGITRVIALAGDIELPGFGLSAQDYRALVAQIDTVIHNAAQVDFVRPYESLHASNVAGTERVVRFACEGQPKALHFVSSIDAVAAVEGTERLPDEATVLDEPSSLTTGYAQSKWVAEELVREAGRRGLCVTILRPGSLVGNELSGALPLDEWLVRVVSTFLLTGRAFTDVAARIWHLTVVDDAARATALVVREPNAFAGQCLHLVATRPVSAGDLVEWLAQAGYPLAVEPYASWNRFVFFSDDTREWPVSPLRELLDRVTGRGGTSRVLAERSTQLLAHYGVRFAPYDAKHMRAMLDYLLALGVLVRSTGGIDQGANLQRDPTIGAKDSLG